MLRDGDNVNIPSFCVTPFHRPHTGRSALASLMRPYAAGTTIYDGSEQISLRPHMEVRHKLQLRRRYTETRETGHIRQEYGEARHEALPSSSGRGARCTCRRPQRPRTQLLYLSVALGQDVGHRQRLRERAREAGAKRELHGLRTVGRDHPVAVALQNTPEHPPTSGHRPSHTGRKRGARLGTNARSEGVGG